MWEKNFNADFGSVVIMILTNEETVFSFIFPDYKIKAKVWGSLDYEPRTLNPRGNFCSGISPEY